MSLAPRPCFSAAGWVVAALLLGLPLGLSAQDGPLYINEILPENDNQEPTDISGGHADMLELYNAGDDLIDLGTNSVATSYYLSSSSMPDFNLQEAWKFPSGSRILPQSFLTIFCDGNALDALCELHASFGIDNNGTEAVSLWGPEDPETQTRPLLDRIWLPPMRSDVSFGRFPDGAGPAPVPIEDTLDVCVYFPVGESTFGACIDTGAGCSGMRTKRTCTGAPNGTSGNLEPRVERIQHSTATPGANEAVAFRVRVEDDDVPLPMSEGGSIQTVSLRYSVDGAEQSAIPLTFDAALGLQSGVDKIPSRPLERWTEWTGSIPGQPAGSVVKFEFFVEDEDGASSTDPRVQCPEGDGPCNDIGLPGPGCVEENPGVQGSQYVSCSVRGQYYVGYEVPGSFAGLVINEIVALQDSILEDNTRVEECPDTNPTCAFEDYIELTNAGAEPINLTGLWLTDRPFQPRGWEFQAEDNGGTLIEPILNPGEYLIIWCDADGGKCPRPPKFVGDGQECPDPTDVEADEYHTNFALNQSGDQIYLYRAEGDGFGAIDFHEFGRQQLNVSLSRDPDGSREGSFRPAPGGSPGAPTPPSEGGLFLRGDSNADCDVNLSDGVFLLNHLFLGGAAPQCPDAADADNSGELSLTSVIYVLNFLFLGGPAPPAPGSSTPGVDPLEPPDDLGECLVNCSAP